MNDSSDALRTRMAAARGVGSVRIGLASPSNVARDAADAAAVGAGCLPLGPDWQAINEETARALIRTLLTFDLAYHSQCMPADDAVAFAEEFLRLVPGSAQFLTNVLMVDWEAHLAGAPLRDYASNPVTDATFSIAVAAVGLDGAAVLAVEDED